MDARTGFLFLALAAAGCGHEPAPGESVSEVCAADKHGSEVSVSGYLMPPVITIGCVKSCSMEVTASKQERYGVGVTLPVGHGPRTMAGIEPMERSGFPGEVRRLSARAYRLTDDEGTDLGPGDVVRVAGTLRAVDIGDKLDCSLEVTSIRGL